MPKIYYDNDADLSVLKEKNIAVIGYGAQGKAQANMLKESGMNVAVGLRENGESWKKAKEDGMNVMTVKEASKWGDIIHILVPDENHGEVFEKDIKDNLKSGNTLCFSHGFSIIFKVIEPPEDIDVIMVAPKAPGPIEYEKYKEDIGVPALISAHQNKSGGALEIALAMAKAMKFTKCGVLECSFGEEAFEDLFGEQTVLCGGVTELMRMGFETLVEAGYPKEMAYFECIHEMKLVVDLIYKGGLPYMWKTVSNTAEYGGRTMGSKIIGPEVKVRMKDALKRIESGEFAQDWLNEYKNGFPNLNKMRKEDQNSDIEKTRKNIFEMFCKKSS